MLCCMLMTTDDLQEMENDIRYSLDDAVQHIGFGNFQIKLIIVVGLSWMADSMEMMVLSILSPVLTCKWNLSAYREAFITTMVFLGQGFGSVFWGFVSDKFGRKRGLYLSVFLVLIFGILSSQAPSYHWILVLRFVVGFGIGGVPQAVIILTEMLPVQYRGRSVIFLELFWAGGSVFAAALAIVVIHQLNWRYYLLIITSPVLIFLLAALWLPESPRFLLTTGRRDKLVSLIERMCKSNRKPLPEGRLVNVQVNNNHGRVMDLFEREWCRTTALLFVIWFTSAFCYYGIVLLTTEMFRTNINGCHPTAHKNISKVSGKCKKLTRQDYTDFMWTTLAEFPGIIFAFILIGKVGRRKTLAVQFFGASISYLLLTVCTTRTASVVFLFITRGLVTGSFQTIYVYTAEVLPTNIRAVGIGVCSMFARLGAMSTPLVAQVLIRRSFYYVVIAYLTPLLVCVFASLLLKIETAGKKLSDSSTTSSRVEFRRSDYESF